MDWRKNLHLVLDRIQGRERELSDSKGSSPSWTVWFHGFIRRFFWEWFWSPKDSQGFLRLHVQNMSNSARLNPWISPKHIPYGYPCIFFLVFCKEIEVQLLDQAWPNLPGLREAEDLVSLALPWGYPLKIAGWFHGKSWKIPIIDDHWGYPGYPWIGSWIHMESYGPTAQRLELPALWMAWSWWTHLFRKSPGMPENFWNPKMKCHLTIHHIDLPHSMWRFFCMWWNMFFYISV